MLFESWIRPLLNVIGERRRRWSVTAGRAHIELRSLDAPECAALARRIDDAFARVDGVAWAEVNPFTNRLVVAFDPELQPVDVLIGILERVEAACGVTDRPFPSDDPEHPGDLEPIVRAAVEIGGDFVGFGVALLGRVVAFPVRPLQVDVIALVSVIEGAPRIRRIVEERLGRQTASLFLGVANAIAHGFAQSPMGPLVDIVYRSLQMSERVERRRVWQERASTLCEAPTRHAMRDEWPGPRPVALPPGLIEEYVETVFAGSIGAFGLGVVATGSLADAMAGLLGGLPRPARLGREAYAVLLGRTLAGRGVVTLDPGALRRLDRVDTLVMSGVVLATPEGESLSAAARQAGLRVIAWGHRGRIAPETADEVVDDAGDLVADVAALQRAGRVVLLVADGPMLALRAADCGIGLAGRGGAVPWAAHIVTGESLDDVRFLVEACAVARTVAQQSVWLAEVGVGAGMLLAVGGLRWSTTMRIMSAVNVATLASIANSARLAWSIAPPVPLARQPDRTPWHRLEVGEVLRRLETSLEGLAESEAGRRHRLPQPEPAWGQRLGMAFADQLTNPFTPFLAIGAGLSAAVGSIADAVMIGGVTVVNGIIGAAQQVSADDAIADLSVDLHHVTRVRRDGEVRKIDAAELVPGDVLLLQAGDLVRADCRIVEAADLEVDESSLTGESLPVAKSARPSDAAAVADRTSVLYAGTAIAAGRATAVVFAVGDETEAHRATTGGAVLPRSGVEARLQSLIDFTGPVAALAGLAITAAGVLRGRPLREVVSSGVSLAVAAVPEGLPLLATSAQLATARRLSKRGTLVRNPRAIEALGRVDVVCLDKTGTLTEGQLRLRSLSDGDREEGIEQLGRGGRAVLETALRATPEEADGRLLPHLTDRALVDGAAAADVGRGTSWRALAELPFEPGRAYHAVLGHDGAQYRLCVKGAPEVILPRCSSWLREQDDPLDGRARDRLAARVCALAERGLRVLAVAERVLPSNGALDDSRVGAMAFRGFLGLSDPVRSSAGLAIDGLRRAGVRTVMITGDHPSTAASIAAELGLGATPPVTGVALDDMDDALLEQRVVSTTVYARVTPAQKVRIVRALQRAGCTVAMTGDGANDAPAIRMANVGIALSRGGAGAASVARGAADLVVTDDRIETLVDAILEGRAMWASVRDAVAVLVGGNLGEIAFTLGAGLLGGGSPLNARQLLLVNLLTDALPAIVIAVRPPRDRTPEALLHEGPEASLGAALERDIVNRALVTAGGTGAAWMVARSTGSAARASTVALVTIVGAQLGQTLVAGGRSPLVLATGLGSFAVLGTIVQTPGLSHLFGCRPLGPLGWTTALWASAGATVASLVVPRWFDVATPLTKRLGELVGELETQVRGTMSTGQRERSAEGCRSTWAALGLRSPFD